MEVKIREAVQNFWNAVNAGDIDTIVASFAEGAIVHDPVGTPPHETPDQIRTHISGTISSFKELAVKVDLIKVGGDHSASKWTIRGVLADGTAAEIEGIDVARHDADGKIVHLLGFF